MDLTHRYTVEGHLNIPISTDPNIYLQKIKREFENVRTVIDIGDTLFNFDEPASIYIGLNTGMTIFINDELFFRIKDAISIFEVGVALIDIISISHHIYHQYTDQCQWCTTNT